MLRQLLKPILASGWSGLTYLFKGVPDDKKDVFDDDWGVNSPEMEYHWARVENDPSYHNYKNITTEWCRAYAQPASKFLSAIILVSLCLNLLLLLLSPLLLLVF